MFVAFVFGLALTRARLPGCSGKEYDAVPSVLLGRIHADIGFVKKIRHRVIAAGGSCGDSHADGGGGCAKGSKNRIFRDQVTNLIGAAGAGGLLAARLDDEELFHTGPSP